MSIAEKLLTIAQNEPKVFEAGKVGDAKTITIPEINEGNPLKGLLQRIAENTLKVYNAGREWAKRVFATVSGTTVRVDDVSPTEHELTVSLASDDMTDFSAVTVSRYGKNLFDTLNAEKTGGIATITERTQNSITLSYGGSSSTYVGAIFGLPSSLSGKKVTISAKIRTSGTNLGGIRISPTNANGSLSTSGVMKLNVSSPDEFTEIVATGVLPELTEGRIFRFVLYSNIEKLDDDASCTATYNDIQIEVSDAQTDYEPYKEPQTATAAADGTVKGLKSVSPTMTLLTDTEGVTINCKYLQQ